MKPYNCNIDSHESDSPSNDWLEIVRHQVDSLKFGVVQVRVHESKVVQIERTESFRVVQKTRSTFTTDQGAGG
jgi:hypothetical protein